MPEIYRMKQEVPQLLRMGFAYVFHAGAVTLNNLYSGFSFISTWLNGLSDRKDLKTSSD